MTMEKLVVLLFCETHFYPNGSGLFHDGSTHTQRTRGLTDTVMEMM